MTLTRLLACIAALISSGCVLEAIPANTLAGTITLTAERLALLEAAQPDPPTDTTSDAETGRFVVDLECQDGTQVIVTHTYLDVTGVGLFEVVIPAASEPALWSCSFSAPGGVLDEGCAAGGCEVQTRFALGTLRACDADQEGLLFGWDGASRWLDDVVADGYDACFSLDDPDVQAESLIYDFATLELDATTWCGNVTVTQSIGSSLGDAVGWAPFLCYRLYSFGGEEYVEAAIYRGIELGTEKTGCPFIPPLSWRVVAQTDGATGFTSRPEWLENPIYVADLDLSAVVWEQVGRGPEGSFVLTAWDGAFSTDPEQFDAGVPGGLVMETSGPMVALGLVDIPPMLLRDSLEGCGDESGQQGR